MGCRWREILFCGVDKSIRSILQRGRPGFEADTTAPETQFVQNARQGPVGQYSRAVGGRWDDLEIQHSALPRCPTFTGRKAAVRNALACRQEYRTPRYDPPHGLYSPLNPGQFASAASDFLPNGNLGTPFQEAGRGKGKLTSIAAFGAVANDLVLRKVTSKGRIAAIGQGNGPAIRCYSLD